MNSGGPKCWDNSAASLADLSASSFGVRSA